MSDSDPRRRRAAGAFATTHWSLVVAAGDREQPEAQDALAALCSAYWQPIYVFLRRRGVPEDRARDLTQGFFTILLEKNYIGDARRDRGRFRTFLLTALVHYVANETDRDRTAKRGGGQAPFPFDLTEVEKAYRLEPSHDETPERIFDRRWARTLLDAGLGRLRDEMAGSAGLKRFERLLPFLVGESDTGYREAAAGMGMGESAVKVAVHRLRRRLRVILRDEVARTVGDPGQVDDELQHLFAALGA
jgi:RNA polymerase sigma-70 factor (ECF subfamily)